MHRTVIPCLLTASATLSCGGASLLLKTPVSDKCTEAGLRGCPELTEGTLLYIEGDKDNGLRKLKIGAAANAPDELVAFASTLRYLGNIPGAADYMGPVLEVVAVLEQSASKGGGSGKSGSTEASAEQGATSGGDAEDARSVGAESDSARMQTGSLALARHAEREECGEPAPEGSSCARSVAGPFVLTDLVARADCAIFALARNGDGSSAWRVDAGPGRHGMRLVVAREQTLVLGASAQSVDCDITWSGFRPYR